MGRLYTKRNTVPGFEFYGIVKATGEDLPPQSAIRPFDDVTGKPILHCNIGVQDGLIKDVRPEAGSWEKPWRKNAEIFFTYDPAKGFPTKAAGEFN